MMRFNRRFIFTLLLVLPRAYAAEPEPEVQFSSGEQEFFRELTKPDEIEQKTNSRKISEQQQLLRQKPSPLERARTEPKFPLIAIPEALHGDRDDLEASMRTQNDTCRRFSDVLVKEGSRRPSLTIPNDNKKHRKKSLRNKSKSLSYFAPVDPQEPNIPAILAEGPKRAKELRDANLQRLADASFFSPKKPYLWILLITAATIGYLTCTYKNIKDTDFESDVAALKKLGLPAKIEKLIIDRVGFFQKYLPNRIKRWLHLKSWLTEAETLQAFLQAEEMYIEQTDDMALLIEENNHE